MPFLWAVVGLAAGMVAADHSKAASAPRAATPIDYIVVLYQENVSFDHYFATYPFAANRPHEHPFHAAPGTPSVNGLRGALLYRNPNAAAPLRLGPERAATCDQDHEYADEQRAYHSGLVDQFVPAALAPEDSHYGKTACLVADVMGYFDGNTVTALWNYAQHFAMSDNHFATSFGPSTPGALNLVAGNTHGAAGFCDHAKPDSACRATPDGLSAEDGEDIVEHTIIGDPQPEYDACSTRETASMEGPNVGELLSAHHLRWGFFQGGFRPSSRDAQGPHCDSAHVGAHGESMRDYIPHHEPFQYYRATANPEHLEPTRAERIGEDGDRANHQYDLIDFWTAARIHHLPQVAFLKAPAYQDGHAGYSDPLAEQRYLVDTVNRLERLPEWPHMAVIIAYDDSDGWYDHVMPPILRRSATSADALTGPGACGQPDGRDQPGRCGPGPRLPLLVISPYAKRNFVDHSMTEQASILRFIEDNWRLGRLGQGSADEDAGTLESLFDFSPGRRLPPLYLDPATGAPETVPDAHSPRTKSHVKASRRTL